MCFAHSRSPGNSSSVPHAVSLEFGSDPDLPQMSPGHALSSSPGLLLPYPSALVKRLNAPLGPSVTLPDASPTAYGHRNLPGSQALRMQEALIHV